MDNKLNVKTFGVFVAAAVLIFVSVVGWQMTRVNNLDNRVAGVLTDSTQIQVQLSQIQTDLEWIKLKLTRTEA